MMIHNKSTKFLGLEHWLCGVMWYRIPQEDIINQWELVVDCIADLLTIIQSLYKINARVWLIYILPEW